MIEETQRILMNIEREELVKASRRQTLPEHARRAERTARHDHVKAARDEFFHARQERQAFADACAVHPHNASMRPRTRREAEPFIDSRRIVFASCNAAPQEQWNERPASGRED